MSDKPKPLDRDQLPVRKTDKPVPLRDDQIPEDPDEQPKSLPPTTTGEQDRTTESQRRVNLIWEVTQATIALAVVIANLIVAVTVGLNGEGRAVPDILSNSLFLIIGFYFSRTNHSAIGGLGRKPEQPYLGR